MLKIKLQPTGKKKHRMFRVVVAEDRSSRDGKVVDFLGTYDPHQKPLKIEIDHEKAEKWIKAGAQTTESTASLIKRAKSGKFDDLLKRKKVSKHKKAEEKKTGDGEQKPEDEDKKKEEKTDNSAAGGEKPKAEEKKPEEEKKTDEKTEDKEEKKE